MGTGCKGRCRTKKKNPEKFLRKNSTGPFSGGPYNFSEKIERQRPYFSVARTYRRIPVWNLYVDPNSIKFSDEINNVVTLDEKGCGGWEKLIRGRLGSISSLE